MADNNILEERKRRIRDRIQYWRDVRDSAPPGSNTRKWAEKKIRMLEGALSEIEKQEAAHEEEPEDHMGAVGRAK